MEYGTHMTIVHGASCGIINSLSQPVQLFILHTKPWISTPVFEVSHTQLIQRLKNKHFTYRDQHRLWPVLPDLGNCTGLSTPNAIPYSLFCFFPLDCIRSAVLSCFYIVNESIGMSSWMWGTYLIWTMETDHHIQAGKDCNSELQETVSLSALTLYIVFSWTLPL